MNQAGSHYSILIVGDTIEAWLAASYLQRVLRKTDMSVAILPIEYTEEVAGAIVGLPDMVDLHAELGFDERDVLRFCDGCFRLGTSYEDWSGSGSSFVHAYGASPPSPGEGSFHHYWNRQRTDSDSDPYHAFSLAAEMAVTDRFIHPSNDEGAHQYRYGYHLNAGRYREYLKRAAVHFGVAAMESRVKRVLLSVGNDSLVGVQLADGQTVTADAYVDASGFGLLAGALSGSDWERDRVLPFNARYTVEVPSSFLSRERIVAQQDSLLIETPTIRAQYRSLVFDIARTPRAEAEARLGQGGVYAGFLGGWRQPWKANCLALGTSAFQAGPLEGVSLQLVVLGVLKFAELLPGDGAAAIVSAEYNRRMVSAYNRLRDFQEMSYALSNQSWSVSGDRLSPENQIRLEQFRSRGRVVTFDEETFSPESWTGLMLGHGLFPKRIDPLATTLPQEQVRKRLQGLRAYVQKTNDNIPPQRTYLEQAKAIAPQSQRSPA